MSESEEAPKIQIDSDWKAQAQAEKQKLAEQEKATKAGDSASASEGASGGGAGQMPPAEFETLLSTFVTQALFAMGAIPDPQTGQPMLHLELARHHIDMLGVLENKTKGNLTDEEQQLLKTSLYELRSRYVQVANAARDMPTGASGGAPGAGAGPVG